MTQYTINTIKKDLEKLAPDIGKDAEDLNQLITTLEKAKPTVSIDRAFKKSLQKQLEQYTRKHRAGISLLALLTGKPFVAGLTCCLVIITSFYFFFQNEKPQELKLASNILTQDDPDTPYDDTKVRGTSRISEKKISERLEGDDLNLAREEEKTNLEVHSGSRIGFKSDTPQGYKSDAFYNNKKQAADGLLKDMTTDTEGESDRSHQTVRLEHVFLKPMKLADQRMLEYTVAINYESGHFAQSRRQLLAIISEYGFIATSTSSTTGTIPYLNTTFYVKSDKLHELLQHIDKLGMLKSESISVIDHTPGMVWQNIVIDRERLRVKRKNKTIKRVAESLKTWTAREESLEASENRLDEVKFEEWKLKDKITWAQVNFNLSGPEIPEEIKVPMYRNAVTGLVNTILQFSYQLIWLAPFIILLITLWFKRKAIKGLFYRK